MILGTVYKTGLFFLRSKIWTFLSKKAIPNEELFPPLNLLAYKDDLIA